MHSIVRKLMAISLGTTSLASCSEVCSTPIREVRATFADIGDTTPQIVAATYAELGLHSGSRSPPKAECITACGKDVHDCTVYVTLRGIEGRPTSSEGSLVCRFAGEETCHEDFDPFHLRSCPFGCGRLPAFVEARLRRTFVDPVVHHFAQVALLEALSVGAFAQLSCDLERCGVGGFRSRIARARSDERRHARQARAILRRLGAQSERTPRVPMGRRTLEEIALGNAVEGCVHETFGAAVANMQARSAGDPLLRGFFRDIAGDELRHAALSWDLHGVLMDRLPPEARARIERAQRAALANLETEGDPHPSVRRRVGAPSREERIALVRATAASLPYGELV